MMPLLRVDGLRVEFERPGERTTALAGVSLEVAPGEILGLVGETGCGKTLTGLSILGLLPPTARVVEGRVEFEGRELLGESPRRLRELRGSRIAMVFQNPAGAFNPVFTIGDQIADVLRTHTTLDRSAVRERTRAVLAEVGLPDPDGAMRSYPHQLSGGMLQRAMLAMALACRPALLIADEPTTALDVTIAAQVLRLIRRLQREHRFSVLFITHDLAIVSELCDRAAVLYAGRVVETAPTAELFRAPVHPYTRGLLGALPGAATRGQALTAIPGSVPEDPGSLPGCPFAPRCGLAFERCRLAEPRPVAVGPDHAAACFLAGPLEVVA